MTTDELRGECHRGEYVVLHMPPANSRGYTRRLCGRRGPIGEIICGTETHQVVRFNSKAVLRFLEREEHDGQ